MLKLFSKNQRLESTFDQKVLIDNSRSKILIVLHVLSISLVDRTNIMIDLSFDRSSTLIDSSFDRSQR